MCGRTRNPQKVWPTDTIPEKSSSSQRAGSPEKSRSTTTPQSFQIEQNVNHQFPLWTTGGVDRSPASQPGISMQVRNITNHNFKLTSFLTESSESVAAIRKEKAKW